MSKQSPLSPQKQLEWQELFDRGVITSENIKEDWNEHGVLLHFDYGVAIWMQNNADGSILACARPLVDEGYPQFAGSKEGETYYDMIAKLENFFLKPECQHMRKKVKQERS